MGAFPEKINLIIFRAEWSSDVFIQQIHGQSKFNPLK